MKLLSVVAGVSVAQVGLERFAVFLHFEFYN
jgi:hypothetical protein